MLKVYLKLAKRVFAKNRHFLLFNITNLSLGIICGIVVLLYLLNYLSFDKHHLNHSRIYRLGYELTTTADGRSMKDARSSEKIGPMLLSECPEVESYVRFRPLEKVIVKYNDKSFSEDDILYADTSIFNIFTHKFIVGSANTCFEKINSIVLTGRMANKYFGDANPIGKILEIGSDTYEVSGIIEDLPDNVHLKFSALLNFVPVGTQWFTRTCYTYLLINENADAEGIYAKYPQLFEKHMSEQAKRVKAYIDIRLEPLAGIHYNSDLPHDFPKGNKMYIYIFAIVGLFIVFITSINYINMSTAFAGNRAKEIGIKKVFGESVKTLRIYFLIESVLITLSAYLVSVIVVRLIIDSDSLYQIFNERLHFRLFHNLDLYLITMGLAILIGLISGLYPAFYLSSISFTGTGRSGSGQKRGASFFKKFLIVFQFVLSISVLVGVLAMNKQISYLNSRDLGYNRDNLILIPVDNLEPSAISLLEEKLLRDPGIVSLSSSYLLPNSEEYMCNFKVETESGLEEQLFNWSIVGPDYFKTMEVQFIEGRDFNKDFASDANSAYIVNESFLQHYGWNSAVDKRMQIINGGYFRWPEGKIIGVIKDFNIASLHKEIEPMIFVMLPGGYLHIRTSNANIELTLGGIESAWTEIAPGEELNYTFMNEHLSDSYLTEINQFRLVKIFSVICIILSCLGLIGLSAYTISKRTKEVAIRKQLGASIAQIIMVLYKDIAVLILLAIIITIPLSGWAVNLWLDSFAYRIRVGGMIFVFSTLIAFLMGFLSVLYHSLKLAYINPVETLKCE